MTPFIKKRSRANPSRGFSAIIYFLDSIWHYSIAWCQSCKTKTKENADKGYTHSASQRAHWSAEQSMVLAASQPRPKHQLSEEQQCRTAWKQACHHLAGPALPMDGHGTTSVIRHVTQGITEQWNKDRLLAKHH